MKHLQESLRAWESQLDSYRMNMAKLQDAEAKALQEVSNAKRTIQQLNSHAASEGAGVEETAALEDMPDASSDKEEEKLRLQLQEAMSTCLSSVGVSAKKEVEEISDEETTSKRPRAAETPKTGA